MARTIRQTSHERLGKTVDGGGIAGCEAAIDTIDQPLGNTARRIGNHGNTLTIGFLADEPKRFGPDARQHEHVGSGQKSCDTGGPEPAREMDAHLVVLSRDFSRNAFPPQALRTITRERDA